MASLSPRKSAILATSERQAAMRQEFRRRARFFHGEDLLYLRFLIPEGLKVLEIGCGSGEVLAALKPSYGLGVDFSAAMITQAKRLHPHLDFRVGDIEDPDFVASLSGPFDIILIVDTIGCLDDCQAMLESLHAQCTRTTRIVIAYYSHLWEPLLKFAEWIGLRAHQPAQNVLPPAAIRNLAELADFDLVKSETRLLSPLHLFGLGRLINRFISILPGIRHLNLRHYCVCRSLLRACEQPRSASIVIPARNEHGNIEETVQRIPRFCDDIEIIFVEGHSRDDTLSEIYRVANAYPERHIKVLTQPGKGKADAVFTGFEAASSEILMILDADLTMPPEQLSKFWRLAASGKAEFINGSRLVYPMEQQAMRFLNLLANRLFSLAFSWLLNQQVTDTLCGTKVLRRSDYLRLKQVASDFGDFDPFGDFYLIFGAAKLNLASAEVPIRYASRSYGNTQISRFRHGALLLKMLWFAFLRFKAL